MRSVEMPCVVNRFDTIFDQFHITGTTAVLASGQ